MADQTVNPNEIGDETPAKKSKLPLILGLVLALAGGGAGFFGVQMGLLSSDEDPEVAEESTPEMELDTPSFLPVETLVINLPDSADAKHLLFTSQLEVNPEHADDVAALMPRIVDVLNGYLRAVSLSELEDPTSLIRLRAHMLRRVQVVAGEGRIKDLLIMEFVLN